MPIVLGLHTNPDKIGHAICIIGTKGAGRGNCNLYNETPSWQLPDFIAHDDNNFPYRELTKQDLGTPNYSLNNLSFAMIPLSENLHFGVSMAKVLFKSILNSQAKNGYFRDMNLKKCTYNIYISKATTFKNFIVEKQDKYSLSFRTLVAQLPLPKFVWILEGTDPCYTEKGYCHFRILVDPGSHKRDRSPWLAIFGVDKLTLKDRTGVIHEVSFSTLNVERAKNSLHMLPAFKPGYLEC